MWYFPEEAGEDHSKKTGEVDHLNCKQRMLSYVNLDKPQGQYGHKLLHLKSDQRKKDILVIVATTSFDWKWQRTKPTVLFQSKDEANMWLLVVVFNLYCVKCPFLRCPNIPSGDLKTKCCIKKAVTLVDNFVGFSQTLMLASVLFTTRVCKRKQLQHLLWCTYGHISIRKKCYN